MLPKSLIARSYLKANHDEPRDPRSRRSCTHSHEAPRWLVEELIPERGLSVLAAAPKAGKTLLSMALAMAVGAGSPHRFLGRKISRSRCNERTAILVPMANARDLKRAEAGDTNLRKANLSGANLSGANLSEADLRGADLRGANLYGAYFYLADLSGANLSEADLGQAHLDGANLTDAKLTDANLYKATLRGADLTRADFAGAYLYFANFNGATLPNGKKHEAK
jgi:uncharacterized protein YjbI with pentapeptide repeats